MPVKKWVKNAGKVKNSGSCSAWNTNNEIILKDWRDIERFLDFNISYQSHKKIKQDRNGFQCERLVNMIFLDYFFI